MSPPDLPEKVCPICGRGFAWRKRWARTWASVVYCSDACRRRKNDHEASELDARIVALLQRRAGSATICPSEVLPAEDKQDHDRMEAVRAAARRLAHGEVIDILQRGAVVDPDRARGPIRLRLRRV